MKEKDPELMDLKVSNDLVFQKIFGKVGNESITKRLLEKILGIKIKKLTLNTNKRMQLPQLDSKTGRLDVKAELEDGTTIHIEMQSRSYPYMEIRFVFYNDAVFLENIKMGKGYSFENNKAIGILITDYDLGEITEGIEKYHTIWNYREKDYPEKVLLKNKEIHIIELKKFEKYGEEDEELATWIKFLKVKGMEDMRDVKSFNEELEKAKKELEILASNREAQEEYFRREMELRDYIFDMEYSRDKGMKQGIEEGKARGKAESKKEIAKKLLKLEVEIDKIVEATGLTKEEIESLKD